MTFTKANKPRLPWRDYLTAEEESVLSRAEALKAEWEHLNIARAGIVNRAIQRAKAKRSSPFKGAAEGPNE